MTSLIAIFIAISTVSAQDHFNLPGGTTVQVKTLTAELNTPVSIAMAYDGYLWVADRNSGNIWRMNAEPYTKLMGTTELSVDPENAEIRGYLHSIEVMPVASGYGFLVFTMKTTHENVLIIEKRLFNGTDLSDAETILTITKVPYNQGHRLRALSDRTLLVSTGSYDDPSPSRLDNLNGKVIRIDENGQPLSTNPYYKSDRPGSAQNFIYSIGHRQASGLVQLPWSHPTLPSRVFNVEPGANGADEINLVQAGRDHGWRRISGYCDGESDGFICPKATFNLVPSSIAYYGSNAIPEWNNTFLIGTLSVFGGLVVADLNNDGTIANIDLARPLDDVLVVDENRQFLFVSPRDIERVRDVAVDETGRVYLAVFEGVANPNGRIVVLENPAVHTPVGVSEDASISDVRFGPNPIQTELYVTLAEAPQTSWTVSIVNMLGQTLVHDVAPAHAASATLHTASLPYGSYMLVVEAGNAKQAFPITR
jgi:glucose/arabinose dehydrogenase